MSTTVPAVAERPLPKLALVGYSDIDYAGSEILYIDNIEISKPFWEMPTDIAFPAFVPKSVRINVHGTHDENKYGNLIKAVAAQVVIDTPDGALAARGFPRLPENFTILGVLFENIDNSRRDCCSGILQGSVCENYGPGSDQCKTAMEDICMRKYALPDYTQQCDDYCVNNPKSELCAGIAAGTIDPMDLYPGYTPFSHMMMLIILTLIFFIIFAAVYMSKRSSTKASNNNPEAKTPLTGNS